MGHRQPTTMCPSNVIASRLWQLRLPQCRKYACMQSISTGQGLSSGQIKPWVAWSYLQPPIPVLVVQLLQPLVVGLCVPALRGHIRDHRTFPLYSRMMCSFPSISSATCSAAIHQNAVPHTRPPAHVSSLQEQRQCKLVSMQDRDQTHALTMARQIRRA